MTVHTDADGNPVSTCAPCHPGVDTTMTGVTTGPAGLVAVGWIFQGFHGEAWHSADGSKWILDGQLAENTILHAVAADDHRYVAVGLNGKSATAWSSTDGLTWVQAASPEAFAATPLRLTAVTTWAGGFVAAGYEGYESGTADAAFWISSDGLMWRRAPDTAALADARAWAVVAGGPGLVAVGTPGPSDAPGSAVVWTSRNGLDWSRVPRSAAFDDTRLRTVTNIPGIGLVAAGESLAGDRGAVLTSEDGLTWTGAGVSPYLGAVGIQLQMNAVIAGDPGGVVVGTLTTGIQYGKAVVWTSADGRFWAEQKSGVEFGDGELTAVTASGSKLFAVGDRGAPDTYVATVWTSPAGWAR